MSDQSTPGPDPSPPQQPTTPAAVPAPPGWTPATAPATAATGGPRRWWDEATSTGGGRAALAAVAVLGALFVVVGLGLTTALVASHHRGADDRGIVGMRGDLGPGPGLGKGKGMGPGMGRGQGQGRGQGDGGQQGPGRANPADPNSPFGPGRGMGSGIGRGAGAALGAVLHGEFTTNLTGTPTVMVVQTGQVTAYAAGKSLSVKSTDGFEATYTLDAATPTLGSSATQLANGVQVRVVAAKEGMKVSALVVGG
jgi:Chitobiase/beta-hexosaminidase C-terminal domain